MAHDQLAFFTLDRGTASTAAALIAPLEGRFRLLASVAQPAGLPTEPLLERLVADVVAAEPGLLGGAAAWRSWPRLTSGTRRPARALLAAATERRLGELEAAAAGAGWAVAGRISPDRTDALQATGLCLSGGADLLVVGVADDPAGQERAALPDLLALLQTAAQRRHDLTCLLTGAAARAAEGWPPERLLFGPAPIAGAAARPTPLRDLLRRLGERLAPTPDEVPLDRSSVGSGGTWEDSTAQGTTDGRRALSNAVVSLAGVLGQRVEAVDVGASAGLRVLAAPDGIRAELLMAEAALVPEAALDDDRLADAILAWSTLRGDAFLSRDRLRNVRLWPWRDAAGDGARLRLAAARAALGRLDAAWRLADEPSGLPASPAADLLVASGGAFSVAPPPAVALALVDTLRRPGGLALVHDHARVLAPLGTLADEADRRRLLVDLLDDILVPLGSAIIATGVRASRHPGTLRVRADDQSVEVELIPGAVQVIDLPPGQTGVAELETRDGSWLGMRARRVAVQVGGGLGGLLVDTRELPLRLPERLERRRDLLAAWERPLWQEDER
ncbi:MAG: hypothetical protein ACXVAP_02290 [Candidatus Limnocylindrales bacterium]